MRTISLIEAPAARPQVLSTIIPDYWLAIVDAPQYQVPEGGFATTGTRIAQGVAEISSPLLITNVSEGEATVSVEILRSNNDRSVIASEYPVYKNDSVLIPIQGQFLISGDRIRVRGGSTDALYATLSWTEGQAETGVISR